MVLNFSNPFFIQFGDAAKFQPELNSIAAKVQRQEAELSALQVIFMILPIFGIWLISEFDAIIQIVLFREALI